MRCTRKLLAAAAVAFAMFAAGCSGDSQSGISGSPALPGSGSAAPAAYVELRIAIPRAPAAASARKHVEFISPATTSVATVVTASSGKVAGRYVGNCAAGFCVQSIDAPIGNDTFDVKLFDEPSAGGQVLSSGSTVFAVAAGRNNRIVLTFDPVVASVSALASGSLFAGMAQSLPVVLTALDPSGATIVGPGVFQTASGSADRLTLSLVDPTGHRKLRGQTSFASPAPAGAPPATTLGDDGTPPNFVYPLLEAFSSGLLSRQRP